MTAILDTERVAPQPKQDPDALVLRGAPRSAVRFRRGLIVGLCGAVAAALVTVSWVALEPPSFRKAVEPVDAGDPGAQRGPDALAKLPGSYGAVPRLGPPLPGDLGRPILEQQRSLGEMPPVPAQVALAQPDPLAVERERAAAASQAARVSPVLVQLGGPTAAEPASVEAASPAPLAAAASPAGVSSDQQHKLDFVRSSPGEQDGHALRPAPSPWMLAAGTVIPASLITGLNSDLPGMVLAQVTENVRDSATGQTVLVPQGARLIGRYDSVVAYGQRRALVVWTRIVFPDGASIGLDSAPATDAAGYSGLADKVDSHGWQLLKGVALSTLLGVGTQLGLGGSESGLVRAIRESAQQNAAHAGDQITSRNLEVQPTLTVRPGWPVRVLVDKDLVLQPWRG